jgi:hypothetical protein
MRDLPSWKMVPAPPPRSPSGGVASNALDDPTVQPTSAASALGTVSSGFTRYHARSIRPCSSTRNDERMMPVHRSPSS